LSKKHSLSAFFPVKQILEVFDTLPILDEVSSSALGMTFSCTLQQNQACDLDNGNRVTGSGFVWYG